MTLIPTDFKPRYLSDAQLEQLERNPGFRQKGRTCPVCGSDGTSAGVFKYNGVEYECPQDDYGHAALQLARLYWLHNIPLEYQQLVWEEWDANANEVKDTCDTYVELFAKFSLNGVGMTFFSQGLGSGKTWAATATLKRLVKQGVDGWFAPFYEVASYFQIDDRTERAFKIGRVTDAALLVLDEVRKPTSKAHKTFLAEQLENLIRPRMNANLPTIITTNMTDEEIEDTFPRAFSLISGKNIFLELNREDYRLGGGLTKRNIETIWNEETLPIT